MEQLKMHTTDGVNANLERIAALFPNCVTETTDEQGNVRLAVDYDKLRVELGEVVEGNEERYQFTWPGKRDAMRLANSPIAAALRPVREDSVNFDTTQNLYIEGDNLDVLKLLRETYLGKVKMIYIDPPYNTGNDFVYEDDFSQAAGDYLTNSGQYDEQGNRLVANTESNGRFHTDWLNMIYPRLKVARDLLTDDGVIFISIDDNEVDNLKKVCSEIFGAANFFSQTIIRSNSRGQTYKQIARTHEYLLIFTKSEDSELFELEKDLDNSDLNLVDDISSFNIRELRNRNPKFGRHNRPALFYPIYVNTNVTDKDGFHPVSLVKDENYDTEVIPLNSEGRESCWRWGKPKCLMNISENTLKSNLIAKAKSTGGFNIYEKYRKTTYKPKSIWDDNCFLTETGTVDMKKLGFSSEFDFPKPTELIKRCLQLSSINDDIVLDFFSGSATTAHAVMQLNAEDCGNRKFIMVQLPEVTDEKSEARKAGYANICEIGKERIRRAGKKILKELELKRDALSKEIDRMLHARPSATAQLLLKEGLEEIAGNIYKEQIMPKQKELKKVEEQLARLDIGFRVLRLDSSNMEDVYYTPDKFDAANLFTMADNVKADRSEEDLLFQVMLELDVPLSADIKCEQIAGKKVFVVADGHLIATFDREVNESTVTEIAKQKPNFFVMRDASAANDNVLDNFEQIFRHYSPDTICKIL
jgi:adenine-specific DNA-methyltransferase